MEQPMRDGMLPAAVVAATVITFVGYLSFQGASHAVDFAVTSSDLSIVPAADHGVQESWQRRAAGGQVMLVDVTWAADEAISAGSYAVMVKIPHGWRHLGCRPECEWSDDEELREFAGHLPRAPYRLAATYEAEEVGRARLAFHSSTRAPAPSEFVPTALLVQTNGDDVLGAEPIPLS
jgi:hypothetical protein